MLDGYLFILALAGALGSGLIGGVFFAFSDFVMPALALLPAQWGMVAMQSINVTVLNRGFLGVFMGMALLSVVALVSAMLQWHRDGAVFLFAGSLLYLGGSFLVTIVFNVPRNETLAAAGPKEESSAALWSEYLAGWTRWNHVRTGASLIAAFFFCLALLG